MASSSHSTPFGAPHLASPSLDPYRDQAGFLPLVPCHKCRTVFIGRVSQKPGSKGKRFYKCPLLEHVSGRWLLIWFWGDAHFFDFSSLVCQTDFACGVYYFEEQYINYLVAKGVLPRACSQVRVQGAMALEVMREGNDKEKACQGFDGCQDLLETAVIHLQGSEALLKSVLESNKKLLTNMNKIGERLLVVGGVMVFVLVLVLLVLLVKWSRTAGCHVSWLSCIQLVLLVMVMNMYPVSVVGHEHVSSLSVPCLKSMMHLNYVARKWSAKLYLSSWMMGQENGVPNCCKNMHPGLIWSLHTTKSANWVHDWDCITEFTGSSHYITGSPQNRSIT